MNAYSRDLRLKTLAAIDRGIPRKEIQDLFGDSRSTIKRWLKGARITENPSRRSSQNKPSTHSGEWPQ
jgi:transposase